MLDSASIRDISINIGKRCNNACIDTEQQTAPLCTVPADSTCAAELPTVRSFAGASHAALRGQHTALGACADS